MESEHHYAHSKSGELKYFNPLTGSIDGLRYKDQAAANEQSQAMKQILENERNLETILEKND